MIWKKQQATDKGNKMKQNTIAALKKIIEEAVQKEVAKQIKIVVQEIVNPSTPSTNVETRPVVEDKPKINVKDPVLNQILNEGGISYFLARWGRRRRRIRTGHHGVLGLMVF